MSAAILDVNLTDVGNVGASGPDDLIAFTIPANTLVRNGECLDYFAWGTTANNTNAKTIAFVWGGQTIATKQLTVSVAGAWSCQAVICRTGLNTQDVYAEITNANGSTVSSADSATAVLQAKRVAGTQTETSTIVVKMQSTASTTTNDVVQDGHKIGLIN